MVKNLRDPKRHKVNELHINFHHRQCFPLSVIRMEKDLGFRILQIRFCQTNGVIDFNMFPLICCQFVAYGLYLEVL